MLRLSSNTEAGEGDFYKTNPIFLRHLSRLVAKYLASSASSSSTRTVTDPVCAFGSRQGRSGENRRRGFLRNEPNFPGETEAVALSALEFPCITFIEKRAYIRPIDVASHTGEERS